MRTNEAVVVRDSLYRTYSHVVIWPGADGKRQKKYFTNETEASACAKEKRADLGDMGKSFGSITEPERAAVMFWREFAKVTSPAPPALLTVLQDFARGWKADKGSMTIVMAFGKYLSHQEAEGAGDRHLATLKSRIGRLVTDKGTTLVAAMDSGVFADWLNGLRGTRRDKSGSTLSLVTRENLKRSCRTFFSFCVGRGWTGTNPVPISPAKRTNAHHLENRKAPSIMHPTDVTKFLRAVESHAPQILPLWAFKFFAGIRDAEATRMQWEMVNTKNGFIDMPAAITKTGHQRRVKIEPTLAEWISPCIKKSGPVAPTASTVRYYYKKVLRHLRKPEKKGDQPRVFNFPSNAARHCFGTYHLFAFRDAGETALQLGHKGDPAMLWAHYANPAAEDCAKAFWDIRPTRPSNVVSMRVSTNPVAPKSKKPRRKANRG
ncbi:MAG: hypothetical protein NTV46_13545 [Verrucomicrobia bacterium]|nr:hypothetical protein [Verrucomicrobiota bacterium]